MPAIAIRKPLLKIPEVAAILKLSPKYIRQLIDEGKITAIDLSAGRAHRVRRTLRVEPDALRRFRAARERRNQS